MPNWMNSNYGFDVWKDIVDGVSPSDMLQRTDDFRDGIVAPASRLPVSAIPAPAGAANKMDISRDNAGDRSDVLVHGPEEEEEDDADSNEAQYGSTHEDQLEDVHAVHRRPVPDFSDRLDDYASHPMRTNLVLQPPQTVHAPDPRPTASQPMQIDSAPPTGHAPNPGQAASQPMQTDA